MATSVEQPWPSFCRRKCIIYMFFLPPLCISQLQRCPSPPGQPRGICSNVCPGGGALAILSQPGGWALAYPGATPGHLTHVFLNMEEFVGKDEDFVKDWLVRHGLEKLVDVFKSMFSQF